MKKIIMLLMLILVSAFVMADGEIVGEVSDFSDTVILEDEEAIFEENPPDPWWQQFFGLFSFVDYESQLDRYQECELDDAFGSFEKDRYQILSAGKQCDVGQYILFQANGGDRPAGTNLFGDAWYKSDSDNLLPLHDYYTDSLEFTFSYACYDCDFVQKYSCDWGQYPAEGDCEKLREDYYDDLNDCTPFDINDCFNSIECFRDSDCTGDESYLGSPYCSGGDVWQEREDYACINNRCATGSTNVEREDCGALDCVDGECKQKVITTTTTSTTTTFEPVTTTTIQIPKITCYTCIGGESVGDEYRGYSCPSGTSATPKDCEEIINETECYYCENNTVMSSVFNSESCPSGYFEEQPDCTKECKDYQIVVDGECKTSVPKWFNYIWKSIKDWFAKVF